MTRVLWLRKDTRNVLKVVYRPKDGFVGIFYPGGLASWSNFDYCGWSKEIIEELFEKGASVESLRSYFGLPTIETKENLFSLTPAQRDNRFA